ncbi:hypothetical protein PAE9249_05367 [Paenibacillus sp. CECT 9249]|uniref:hypothetical protein n=1 Tax=Paenibacillus sp. CECT 9249 TaxID=2845385 RepID=UPI001E47F92F|nr:hypothetical protein [Paenibacillus sp. CECT 9249]CAH0122776.1 hypothetical protein PAE9249_05367 [Paenibacillus sp. CECT 9249]
MSKELRKALFEAVHLNHVWPEELLANAKLPNYEYVHYTKLDDHLIVEMKFEDMYTKHCYAYYQFDLNEKLFKITIKQNDEVTVVYDRQIAIATAYLRLVEAEGEAVAKEVIEYSIAS